VFWTYVENPDFSSDLSASIPICGKSDWVISSINLTGAKSWDSSKTVVKIKIEITAGDQKIATIDPARGESDSPEFVLNYLVFDRAAFSDTFQR
jgi:hypothetical protein